MQRQVPEGYRVWITHYRDPNEILSIALKLAEEGKEQTPIIAVTEAKILDPDGNVVVIAYSHCSQSDQFSKRRGRLVATGRALKKLEEGT